jgi:17beta-estradiol 17-dehydrogenase / very-long-chain 3-oxoacyl-CoA reductase
VLGALTALYLALRASCALWCGLKQFILARGLGLTVNFRSLGAWAVVTGSTDGIGKAYAESFAKRGLNVVLISRTLEKLTTVAKEIESKYKVETRVIAADFAAGPEIYTRIAQGLAGLDIAVLVNNVGTSYDFPVFFTETDDKNVRDIVNINCHAVTFMTKIVLPGMVEKRKGAIINISSLTAIRRTPLLTVYSATKAYVERFSECIHDEYRSKGIIVQNVAPGFVATKLSKIRNATLIAPTPESFVRSAVATVGVVRYTCGCIPHAIQALLTRSLPEWIHVKATMTVLHGARAKGLKKKQEKKE